MKHLYVLFATFCCLSTFSSQAQVPQYSSLPGAPAVIFLDFDGHLVSGTSWNFTGPIVCEASGLTTEKITEIYNRVAEDYRPFNVNVTTDSTYYLAAAANRRMRAILTVSSEWYGSAGGVAYVGSFSWGDDTPCFIFTQLLNFNQKNIAEAAAHEVGHTLGLRHQSSYNASCGKISDYNYGQGSGEIGWAPIMGVGYYQNFTLWHNGPNSNGCTSYQNDLSVITSATNGISFRTDDHGADYANATASVNNANQFVISGVIERTDDEDLFKFTMPGNGEFSLDAIPYNVGNNNAGSNLDLQVELISSSYELIGIYNPGNSLGSVVDTTLSAGDYFLRIDGKGNMYTSEYGSLGSYSLQGTFTTSGVLPLRRLELRGSVQGSQNHLQWIIDADEEVRSLILEASSNGNDYEAVAFPSPTDRTVDHDPSHTGALQYRLLAEFVNGNRFYSNIVSLRNESGAGRPKVINQYPGNGQITIQSPFNCQYMITDLQGRILQRGRINTGTQQIDLYSPASGILIIRFSDSSNQWTEKIIRQGS